MDQCLKPAKEWRLCLEAINVKETHDSCFETEHVFVKCIDEWRAFCGGGKSTKIKYPPQCNKFVFNWEQCMKKVTDKRTENMKGEDCAFLLNAAKRCNLSMTGSQWGF